MRSFVTKIVNVLLIVALLAGYNAAVTIRSKDDEIAKLKAQLQSVQESYDYLKEEVYKIQGQEDGQETEEEAGSFKDGTYTGEAEGFGGTIQVSVTVEAGSISEITIDSADGEDNAYLTMAEDVIETILKAQSADVDTVSGATYSSTGIREAVRNALKEASS